MSNSLRMIVAVFLIATAGRVVAGQELGSPRSVDALATTARRAGLRVIESDRLVLATDRPARDGDGVNELPEIFDQAVDAWCDHYGIAAASLPDWRYIVVVVIRIRNGTHGTLSVSMCV